MIHQAEALVLRTWPIHEADMIVSLFTRDQGKIKGVAKAASKSRKRFGGALEPMTHVLANYAEKPRQELVRLDSFEIVSSPLSGAVDYTRAAALGFYAEVLEEILPMVHLVLIMSVNPGFGGQSFIPFSLDKIRKLREMREMHGLGFRIEVDGGIAHNTVAEVVEAGADLLVAGNAVFGKGRAEDNARSLLHAARMAAREISVA